MLCHVVSQDPSVINHSDLLLEKHFLLSSVFKKVVLLNLYS